jgi:hypothetical protein
LLVHVFGRMAAAFFYLIFNSWFALLSHLNQQSLLH